MKQELLKWIYENKVGRPSVFGLGTVETVYMDDLIEMINELEEPQVTNEQAWNKIAETYPETAQNLRITLDHAVYGHEAEPQKVKVPECVGELLDYYRKSADVDLLALLICFKDWYFRNDKTSESEEAIDWLVKHPEKFMKAWIDGYEVDEERKYYIRLTIPSSSVIGLYLGFNKDGKFDTSYGKPHITWGWKCRFTEKEIKAIDERYWPFAVPVEKV